MLGSNERLQRGDGRRFSQISQELSASQTSIGSSSDIQQHLQSMFYLLRPEETLKMVRDDDEVTLTRQSATTIEIEKMPIKIHHSPFISIHIGFLSLQRFSFSVVVADSDRACCN
jgi:hypothetical protein